MRDPNRIYKICNALAEQWSRVPDQRLMQLIVNLQSYEDEDLFFCEDKDFIRILTRMLDKIAPM